MAPFVVWRDTVSALGVERSAWVMWCLAFKGKNTWVKDRQGCLILGDL